MHTGIPIFTPTIDIKGNLKVSVHLDKRITSALNPPGAFRGKVKHRENIGKTSRQIAALWNENNPANPVQQQPELEQD